ncbi:MAG: YggT family protein [Dehalococcoidia bacterium]
MFNFGDINTLGGILAALIQLLALAIFLRAILSWVVRDPYNPVVQFLDQITEPILQPLRQIMPRMGMMDLSPLVAIILLQVLASLVRQSGI